MSYILDALRKADAQRERDVARGIHAQPMPAAAPRRRAGPAPRLVAVGTLAAGILVAAAAGWYLTKSPAPAAVAAAPPVQPREPQPSIATAIVPSPAPAPIAPPAPTRGVATPALSVAQPAPEPAAGLPPDAPKVAISGGVYSPDPAQRMLIVGGQVFNEGSEVAPGLTIDRIETRTAILKFRGGRYSVAY